MSRRPGVAARVAVLAVLALAVLAALTACTGASGTTAAGRSPGGSTSATSTVLQPCPAPSTQPAQGATTLPRLSLRCPGGGTLDLARAPGVPMVVNLWGSWCSPCRAELPVVQQLADAVGDRVRVLGVISKDGMPQAESFAEDAKVTFPSAFDGQGDLMAKEGLNYLPVTYFVDASGAVTYTQVGPVGSLDQFRRLVADHLGVQL